MTYTKTELETKTPDELARILIDDELLITTKTPKELAASRSKETLIKWILSGYELRAKFFQSLTKPE